MGDKKIGELLVELGVIEPHALEQAIKEHKRTGNSLGEVIIRKGMVSIEELEGILARQHSVPPINLENYTIPAELLLLVPEDYLRKKVLIPVALDKKTLTVAMSNPSDIGVIDELSFMTGKQITPVVAARTGIKALLDKLFPHQEKLTQIAGGERPVALTVAAEMARPTLNEAFRVFTTGQPEEAFQALTATVASLGASHLHLTSGSGSMKARARLGDKLGEEFELPAKSGEILLKRLRALCGVGDNGARISQSFFDAKLCGKYYRVNFNSIPLPDGESAVLYLEPPPIHSAPTLDVLGMYPEVLAVYREMLSRGSGLILFPAPPGSGKTTTIYATLEELKDPAKRTVSVESPIRRQLEGVEQLDPAQLPGADEQWLLQALSGQNIDHLMIRDVSTPRALQSALRAARAGALVLGRSDHHGALGFIANAGSMGIDPTLLANELLGIVGQRLVGMLCSHCITAEEPPAHLVEELRRLTGRRSPTLYNASGCDKCRGTGKLGKVGVYELFPASERLTQLIIGRAGEHRMREVLSALGARTLNADGLLKAADGLVGIGEVLAAI